MPNTIIVTGASSGIGEATARYFAAQGWNVVLAARSQQKLLRIADELSHSAGHVLAIPTDVTNYDDVNDLVQQTMEQYGRIDVLINNAGASLTGTVANMNLDDLEKLFRLNVFAPVMTLQAVVPHMRQQGHGVIVNVSSVIENLALPFLSAYAASKIALSYLTDAARLELKHMGIDVVNVLPGQTRTPFGNHSMDKGDTGDFDLSVLADQMETTRNGVPPERVAQTIWNAVRKGPRRTYVTWGDWIGGEIMRRLPGLLHVGLSFALDRYVPRTNQADTGETGSAFPSAAID